MENPNIKFLFEPNSVAVIGASRHREKIGYQVLKNIMASGYKSKIYPVNPEADKILGLKVYRNLNQIEENIDLVFVTLPAHLVLETIKNTPDKKVKFFAIITSGFSEIGNLEGEKKIVEAAYQKGARVLGPNIFGLYSSKVSLNGTFGPQEIKSGSVAIITQSGALGLSMIGKTAAENLGISSIVSIGNRADINCSDLLEYLANDRNTKVILLYIEGVKNGQHLFETLKKINQKPIIVIKAGRSEKGASAAASHTGSLAGSDAVFDAVIRQAGIQRAESVKEAFNWCKFIVTAPLPTGQNTVIITNGGGLGVLTADACKKYQVSLLDDPVYLNKIFGKAVPLFGSTKNPIDVSGQASAKDYSRVLELALNQKRIHSVISLYCETAVLDIKDYASLIKKHTWLYHRKSKPIVFSALGGPKTEKTVINLKKNNYPVFDEVNEAVSCLGALNRYTETSLAKKIARQTEPLLKKNLFKNKGEILTDLKIPFPKKDLAHSANQAIDLAEKIGYPVVLKIISPQILHKTEAGGVFLNLINRHEVDEAYAKILQNVKKFNPQAEIKGIEVSQMLKPGVEIIVGAKKDPAFGPVILFGLGGIYVEIFKETTFRSFPASRKEILEMIKETKAYPILAGARGKKKKDIRAIIETLIKLGTVIAINPQIKEIEINPLVVYEKGVCAPDLRVIFSS